jgi:hypothetical protein
MEPVKRFLVAGGLVVLTALAVVFAVDKVTRFRADGEAGAKVWFYDQKTTLCSSVRASPRGVPSVRKKPAA